MRWPKGVATANPVGVAADVLGVLDSIDIPVVVVDRDCKVENNPIDYRFLEVNPAFQRQTGINDARGRLMREIAPSHEQHWFDIYGRIALTGETLRFENPAAALRRHFEVCAFRVGAPELRHVGIVFNDITERKNLDRQRELALAQEEALRKDAETATRALAQTRKPCTNGWQNWPLPIAIGTSSWRFWRTNCVIPLLP